MGQTLSAQCSENQCVKKVVSQEDSTQLQFNVGVAGTSESPQQAEGQELVKDVLDNAAEDSSSPKNAEDNQQEQEQEQEQPAAQKVEDAEAEKQVVDNTAVVTSLEPVAEAVVEAVAEAPVEAVAEAAGEAEAVAEASPEAVAEAPASALSEEEQKKVDAFLKANKLASVNAAKKGGFMTKAAGSALHVAVNKKDANMVALLLKAGADVSCKDSKQLTSLELAKKLDKKGSYQAVIQALESASPAPAAEEVAAEAAPAEAAPAEAEAPVAAVEAAEAAQAEAVAEAQASE